MLNKYKTEDKYKDTFGLKGIDKYKSKLVTLDFDFTSLHEFLGTSRHVLNQHASLLNHLREDAVTKCTMKDLNNFFMQMTRSYPKESIISNVEAINKYVMANSNLSPNKMKSNGLSLERTKTFISNSPSKSLGK